MTQSFYFNFYTPDGPLTITQAMMLFNSSLNSANACYVVYGGGQLGLMNDAGSAATFIRPNSLDVAQNSQCTLYASGSSASTGYSNSLQITLSLQFNGSSVE